MPLRALVVDDEFPAREELASMLLETGAVEVVATCEDGDEALAFLRTNKVDVVFLDIQMPTRDGLSTARDIMLMPAGPKVIFTTGFSEYAVKAFDLEATDYLVKPYSQERLERAVGKMLDLRASGVARTAPAAGPESAGKLPVWVNGRLILLNIDDIFFAKADGKRSTLICARRGNFSTSTTLRELEERLAGAGFVRTHKSYIVNTRKIEEIIPWFNNTYQLVLQECPVRDIPVARHFVREFNRRMRL
jgi:two-component system LytT family response regulator